MATFVDFGGFYGHKMANLCSYGLKIGLPTGLGPIEPQNKYQSNISKNVAKKSIKYPKNPLGRHFGANFKWP